MGSISFEIRNWIGQARTSFSADLLAGVTLWAMLVPEAVAHAGIANAPSAAAGLYTIMIAIPIYALFASSRYLVPTSTAAISATTASFLAVMSSDQGAAFSALVLAAAATYFVFYHFRLGFVADFISEPVSRGFMMGLSIFIIVGQLPKTLGIEKSDGNVFEQLIGLAGKLPEANGMTVIVACFVVTILVGVKRFWPSLPASLIAVITAMAASYFLNFEAAFSVKMVGALPAGLPGIVLPAIDPAELVKIIPAAVGLVILGISESTLVSEGLALKNNQKLDLNKQFFAFGAANAFTGLFGGLMSGGSTSGTMVNTGAGAKTPMSSIWVAALTVPTVLFFTGLFAYLPEAFLGVLVIHAVWHLLKLRHILQIRKFSHTEFYLALFTLLSVLLFDVLDGLLIAMTINVIYYGYLTAIVRVEELGILKGSRHLLLPLTFPGVERLPAGTVAMGPTRGQIFYASTRRALEQSLEIVGKREGVKNIVLSSERLNHMDFTTTETLRRFETIMRKSGKRLFITNIRDPEIVRQLEKADLDQNVVSHSLSFDVRQFQPTDEAGNI